VMSWGERGSTSKAVKATSTEGFADASSQEEDAGEPLADPVFPPDPYTEPESLSISASPAEFTQGLTENPVPPAMPAHMRNELPDPQRYSKLLEERSREELWLACQTRQEHADAGTSADADCE
jgi:hypothetical protein